jgi:hypothetical protein
MNDDRVVTTWCPGAPIDPVFAAIDDSARWPEWRNDYKALEGASTSAAIGSHSGS